MKILSVDTDGTKIKEWSESDQIGKSAFYVFKDGVDLNDVQLAVTEYQRRKYIFDGIFDASRRVEAAKDVNRAFQDILRVAVDKFDMAQFSPSQKDWLAEWVSREI